MKHSPETQSDNIALAVAYRLNGVNFRLSAEKIAGELEMDELGRPTKLTAIPLYFLASHAMELFLKSALLKRGVDETKLRAYNYRHNLAALLAEVCEMGVPVTQNTVSFVQGLSKQHETHQLRYSVLSDNGEKHIGHQFT